MLGIRVGRAVLSFLIHLHLLHSYSTNARLRRRWLGTPGDAVVTECRFCNVWRILVTRSDGRHPGRNVCLSNVCQWQQQSCMSNKFLEFSSVFVANREDKSEQKDFADAAT